MWTLRNSVDNQPMETDVLRYTEEKGEEPELLNSKKMTGNIHSNADVRLNLKMEMFNGGKREKGQCLYLF